MISKHNNGKFSNADHSGLGATSITARFFRRDLFGTAALVVVAVVVGCFFDFTLFGVGATGAAAAVVAIPLLVLALHVLADESLSAGCSLQTALFDFVENNLKNFILRTKSEEK